VLEGGDEENDSVTSVLNIDIRMCGKPKLYDVQNPTNAERRESRGK